MKQIIIIVPGLAWGTVSFFWLGYSILTLGNFMEEPGSLDYVAEGESMRIYVFNTFVSISRSFPIFFSIFSHRSTEALFFLYKRKHYLYSFFVSMILGGIIPGIYIFVLR